jgi:hypothetical protein
MPGSADFVQRMVHMLEAGDLAVWVKRSLAVIAIIALALFYMSHFRGLATAQAMDQAQIGREIASGHGWRTNFIRPRALGMLLSHGKNVQQKIWYDTYNAPLPPLVDAVALFPLRSHLKMTPRDVVYLGDYAIAATAVLLFLASVVVLFFIARRLFDERLALLSCGLVLICDAIWQYSLSGLPQMLMLFLLNATVYAMVRAVQAQYGGGSVGIWLAAAGVGFGLLALSHALTIWIFLGALVFSIFFFRPRVWAAVIVVVPFVLLYTPWLIRNYMLCGHPGGVAIYSLLDSIRYSEAGWMRRVGLDTGGIGPGAFRDKLVVNLMTQLGSIFEYLGWSVVAPVFFVSTLHSFKRPETAVIRWLMLAMWCGAVLGMAVYGIREEQDVAANQLHLIFIPLMTCYGLAFLLVQWNRLEIDLRVARIGFLSLLFLLCGFPLLLGMVTSGNKGGVHWPPYVPPYISVLNDWMQPEEITASDMPWAIAWYANRRSLWVPENITTLTEFDDYKTFGAPVHGLYLTPISGSQNTLRDILKGEYREWATVILRSIDLQKFPLKWATLLGLDNECVFFSDHDRQRVPAP